MARQFVTDCEGPVSKNDNAFELTEHFIPGGGRFFAIVSRYDDILSDVLQRPGYQAGDTLRLIVPFLKAYGVTQKTIHGFCQENLLLVPGAKETLPTISNRMETFIISTSYSPYIDTLCSAIRFPRERVYCTLLDIDRYSIDEEETLWLQRTSMEVSGMTMPEIPQDAHSIEEFPGESRKTIQRLDEIFFNQIPTMASGMILEDVKPIGGEEKAKAIEASLARTGLSLRDVLYVGDSITDVQAFCLVRENGGVSVSFNGNGYAIRTAEVAIVSGHTGVLVLLASFFEKEGKEGVLALVDRWGEDKAGEKISELPDGSAISSETLQVMARITKDNQKVLCIESEAFRSKLRGEKIGGLG